MNNLYLESLSTASKEQAILRRISTFIRQQPSKEGAQQLAKIVEEYDLSYASVLISAGRKYFGEAFRQWAKYQTQIEEPLTRFMMHLNAKITHCKIPSLERLFSPLKQKFIKTLRKPIPLIKQQDVVFKPTDANALEYSIKLRSGSSKKLKNQDIVYIQTPEEPLQKDQEQATQDRLRPQQKLGSGIADSRIQIWRELYSKLRLAESPFLALNWTHDSAQAYKEYKAQEEAHTAATNFADCSCCLSFVCQGQDLAYPGSRQPTAFFGRLSRIGEMQKSVSEQIVSFLNGRGGVLFVGCKIGEGGEVFGVAETTSESLKENIENKVQSWVRTIYPAVTLKRQVYLSFIPIAAKSGGWIKGAYLLRVIVQPTDLQTTYHYAYNQLIHFAAQGALHPVTIQHEDIFRFMKVRYNKYHFSTTNSLPLRETGNNFPALVTHLSPCHLPEKGDQDFGNVIVGTGLGEVSQPQCSNPLLNGRENFKNVSLLVASRQVLPLIERIFREDEKVETIIEPAFPEQKFKLSNSTWLVWHSVKFEKLTIGIKKQMNELKQKNEKKPPLLISTCNYLKIIDEPLREQLVVELLATAKKHACQELEHKLIDDYDFFKCTSPITAVFLYFYLNHHYRKKSVFEKPPVNNKHKHTRPSHKGSEKEEPQTRKFKSPFPEELQVKETKKQESSNRSPNRISGKEQNIQTAQYIQQKISYVDQNIGGNENQVETLRQLWPGGPIIWCHFIDGSVNTWYYCNDYNAYCYNQYGAFISSIPYNQRDLQQAMYYAQQQMNSYSYQAIN